MLYYAIHTNFTLSKHTTLFFYNLLLNIDLHKFCFLIQYSGISIAQVSPERFVSMKVAIPVYGDYVSNVFDFAHKLLLVNIENSKETERYEIVLEGLSLQQRADKLKSLGVDVLVCGAVSQLLANIVMQSGIELLPYVTGNTANVLNAYISGQLIRPEFSMPGCWPGARRDFGQRRNCRRRGRHR